MNHTSKLFAIAMVLALCLSSALSAGRKPKGGGADYNLILLTPPGVDVAAGHGTDLNEFGNAVGCYTDLSGACHGFYYDPVQDAYLTFGAGVEVHGLNNLGQMVGVDKNSGEGLYWSSPADQDPAVLSPLAGHESSHGIRLNDAGLIIGSSQGDGPPVVVAWAVNAEGDVTAPVALPFPVGEERGAAIDLSEADSDGISLVAGYSGTLNVFPNTALAWEIGIDGTPVLLSGPTDLGSLVGTATAAHGVNFHADFVGESDAWPVLKLNGAAMQPLPGLRKATSGYAAGINDNGIMVGSQGWLSRGLPVFKGVLWQDPGTVVDLNKKVDLGSSGTLESAFRVSNSGAILGSGFFPEATGTGDVGCLLIPN